jgi:copper chaperone
MTITTYAVAGMTCAHCVSAVTEELAALPGVQDVSVDLVADGPSQVRVVSDGSLEETQVRTAVDEAGYELVADTT